MIAGAVKNLSEVELAVLFGSIAKGIEQADSDVDVFIVCKGDKSRLEEKLKDLISVIRNKFGNPFSLMIKRCEELKELKTRSIYKEIKSGEVIFRREGFEW